MVHADTDSKRKSMVKGKVRFGALRSVHVVFDFGLYHYRRA